MAITQNVNSIFVTTAILGATAAAALGAKALLARPAIPDGIIEGVVTRIGDSMDVELLAKGPKNTPNNELEIANATADISVTGPDGTFYHITLFDSDPSWEKMSYGDARIVGPATVGNTLVALETGAKILFPTKFDGNNVFDSSRRGRIDVDAIRILPNIKGE